MSSVRFRLSALLLGLLALGGADAAWAADLKLERVVLVQRHGVRAPTQSAATLAGWTDRAWPSWPVGRGMLTPHGAEVVGLVARAMREDFVMAGLLPAGDCPGDGLVVWADGEDPRTRESGRVLAESLAPGCNLVPGMAAATRKLRDPVFHFPGPACNLDEAAARKSLDNAIASPQGPSLADPSALAAIQSVDKILRPVGARSLAGDASSAVIDKSGIRLTGPLAVAASVSEIFLLQYAQDLPVAQVGWGEAADPAQLEPLLAARRRSAMLTRSLPYVAYRQGAGMTRLLLATLAGEPRVEAPEVDASVKVLALAGHDTNLSNMAGVFGLDWALPGQPDATAPATALSLELWRDGTGTALVKARVWFLDLEGMRTLNPAAAHSVLIPFLACPTARDGACPLIDLSAQILTEIPEGCGQTAP